MRRSLFTGAALAVAAIVGTGSLAAGASRADRGSDSQPRGPKVYSFALWGDMPYAKNGDDARMPALIADMNADRSLAFTVFDGDIKDGSSLCADDQYTKAIDLFNSLRAATVYVPGDNEWTDCHRINNGGYDNLERLAHLRQTMFGSAASFGQKQMSLDHQGPLSGAYAENTRWRYGDAVFLGLNVPGSNNNKVNSAAACTTKSARTQAQCDADNAEYAERDAENIDWVRQSFEQARADHAKAVMVVIQADPTFDFPETEDVDERAAASAAGTADGYDNFLAALEQEAQAFPGQVVLVHGDTHFFKVDKPVFGQADLLPNFTRVETFGSPNDDWVKVTVDPQSRNYFTFSPMVVGGS